METCRGFYTRAEGLLAGAGEGERDDLEYFMAEVGGGGCSGVLNLFVGILNLGIKIQNTTKLVMSNCIIFNRNS